MVEDDACGQGVAAGFVTVASLLMRFLSGPQDRTPEEGHIVEHGGLFNWVSSLSLHNVRI